MSDSQVCSSQPVAGRLQLSRLTQLPPFLQPTGIAKCFESGFTTIELVTVILVVGIMAVVVLPRFDLLQGYDETGYRDKVKATLEYSRKSAVAQRRNVQVTLTAASVSVKIASDVPEGVAANTFDRDLILPGSGSNQFSAPSGITLAPPATLTFDPLGRPSAGASFTLTGIGQPITVEAGTGYVH
ncbi:MAG: hypothetical protein Q8O52_13160 [Sulfuritalea sp.]|nr:hypothetical protein [Sulfuritalea sp.]